MNNRSRILKDQFMTQKISNSKSRTSTPNEINKSINKSWYGSYTTASSSTKLEEEKIAIKIYIMLPFDDVLIPLIMESLIEN